jgi:hypothetical protein
VSGEHLDVSSESGGHASVEAARRRYVGIYFACCGVYSRVYVNASQMGYVGYCPRCCGRVELAIGPDGTTRRFFVAS